MNLLFVCRANLQRSPTAEDMVRERASDEIRVKSAGISPNANTRVSAELLEWADYIYVMMEGIGKRIRSEFPSLANRKEIRVLGVEDRYIRGEERLKRRLLQEFSRDDILSDLVTEQELTKIFGDPENL